MIKIRAQIESMFDGKAFKRPSYYNYQDGLRFELSEGGHFLNQFLTAHRKGMEICSDIFSEGEYITVCVKIFGGKSLLSSLSTLKSLREMGLYPTVEKEHWTEFDEQWQEDEYYTDSLWHFIAFKVPFESLISALWCAFATDFGSTQPQCWNLLIQSRKRSHDFPLRRPRYGCSSPQQADSS